MGAAHSINVHFCHRFVSCCLGTSSNHVGLTSWLSDWKGLVVPWVHYEIVGHCPQPGEKFIIFSISQSKFQKQRKQSASHQNSLKRMVPEPSVSISLNSSSGSLSTCTLICVLCELDEWHKQAKRILKQTCICHDVWRGIETHITCTPHSSSKPRDALNSSQEILLSLLVSRRLNMSYSSK